MLVKPTDDPIQALGKALTRQLQLIGDLRDGLVSGCRIDIEKGQHCIVLIARKNLVLLVMSKYVLDRQAICKRHPRDVGHRSRKSVRHIVDINWNRGPNACCLLLRKVFWNAKRRREKGSDSG